MSPAPANFWERDVDTLLQAPHLKAEVLKFIEDAYNGEVHELNQMELAIDRAKEAIILADKKAWEERVINLEKANSMTFLQMAIDFGITLAGGGAIGLLTKAALGRILKNRLLYGTLRHKVRIQNGDFLSTRQSKKLKKVAVNGKVKGSKKYGHYDFGEVTEVLVEDGSWEVIMFKTLPAISSEFGKKLYEEKDKIRTSSDSSFILLPDQFFLNQKSAIATQKNQLAKNHTALKRDIVYIFDDQEQLGNLVASIKSSHEFDKINRISKTRALEAKTYEDIEAQNILAQPIIISAIFRKVMIPKIKPAKKGYVVQGHYGLHDYFHVVKDKPERLEASDPQKAALTKLAQHLFVPQLLYAKRPSFLTFAQKYSGNPKEPDRAILELTKYLHRVQFNEHLRTASQYVIKYLKLLRSLGLL